MSGFQLAEAKRFGGGSSHGYSRSAPTKSLNNNTSTNKAQKKNGLGGMLGGLLVALGLGALFAWLFSAQCMGGLLIALLIAAALIFFLKRRAAGQHANQSRQHNQTQSPNQQTNPFNAFKNHFQAQENTLEAQQETAEQSTALVNNGQLPDGTPEGVFNHQALNLFNQLQTLNNQEGLEKIKSYLSEDLYHSVKADVQDNQDISEFKEVSCKVIDADKQDNQWIFSVMFAGQVKEDAHNNWQNFEEIWHYTRQDGEHLWQVAGI